MDNLKCCCFVLIDWVIKGELFLNCFCDLFCFCVVFLGKYLLIEGYCYVWMVIVIDEGYYEGEDFLGLNIGLLVDILGCMVEGNWKVVVYVDECVSGKVYNGIL